MTACGSSETALWPHPMMQRKKLRAKYEETKLKMPNASNPMPHVDINPFSKDAFKSKAPVSQPVNKKCSAHCRLIFE